MTQDELRDRISRISTWRRFGERAPHKPLLLLLALGQFRNDHRSRIDYATTADSLRNLLEEFGPPRKTLHPEHPFWRLQSDGIWEVDKCEQLTPNISGDVSPKQLMNAGAQAGFTDEVLTLLNQHPTLIGDLAQRILDAHFPETLHEDILLAVGLELPYEQVNRRARDPKFRDLVISAYSYECAVCGFQLRVHNTPVGLEAAHIMWNQAGGPSTLNNGIAMCALHHKLFDRGTFTIANELAVVVSQLVNGSGLTEYLLRFEGRRICKPGANKTQPHRDYLEWHRKEVFRGPERNSG